MRCRYRICYRSELLNRVGTTIVEYLRNNEYRLMKGRNIVVFSYYSEIDNVRMEV